MCTCKTVEEYTLAKAAEHLKRVQRQKLLLVKITNFNFRTVFKAGKLTREIQVLPAAVISIPVSVVILVTTCTVHLFVLAKLPIPLGPAMDYYTLLSIRNGEGSEL